MKHMILQQLKTLRKQQKISLREMGEITGISYSTISDIENGKTNPSLSTLTKMCKTLKAHLEVIPD